MLYVYTHTHAQCRNHCYNSYKVKYVSGSLCEAYARVCENWGHNIFIVSQMNVVITNS